MSETRILPPHAETRELPAARRGAYVSTYSGGIPRRTVAHSSQPRDGYISFVHTGLWIALLHVLLLAALWHGSTHAPAPHEVARQTIEAQLISPDAAPVPVQVEPLRTQPVVKPLPKPTPKPTPKITAPVLPVQAAPSPLTPAATPTSTAPPAPAALPASMPPETQQHATLAATAPKNVEHLECVITAPAYPALSRRKGESGTAMVQIIVDTQGWIESASLRKSSQYERLDTAALQAAQASHCRPYQENGVAIRSSAVVPFRFTLDD